MDVVIRSTRAAQLVFWAGLLMLAGASLQARAEAPLGNEAISEAQVKAAFLFNFTMFVHWPATSEERLTIGIAGDDAFADVVAGTVRGRNVKGRDIHTRRLASGEDPAGCDVVFVGPMSARAAAELIRRVRGPVLMVGETVQFLRDGGMVRLYVEDSKVRFQLNQKNAEAAGLRLSSQMMTLATR